jgi:hypothetical protein
MKRVLFILLAVLFAAGLVAAKEAPKAAKKDAPKQEEFRNGPDREQMRKEFKEMKALVEAYKAAKTDKEKAEAQAAVKAKVAANYDRHLEFMQQRVKASQEKLAALAKKLEEGKKADVKAKKIDEITAKIIAGERPESFGPPHDGKFAGKDADKNDKRPFMKGHRKGGPDAGDDEMLPPPPPDMMEDEDLPEAP